MLNNDQCMLASMIIDCKSSKNSAVDRIENRISEVENKMEVRIIEKLKNVVDDKINNEIPKVKRAIKVNNEIPKVKRAIKVNNEIPKVKRAIKVNNEISKVKRAIKVNNEIPQVIIFISQTDSA